MPEKYKLTDSSQKALNELIELTKDALAAKNYNFVSKILKEEINRANPAYFYLALLRVTLRHKNQLALTWTRLYEKTVKACQEEGLYVPYLKNWITADLKSAA